MGEKYDATPSPTNNSRNVRKLIWSQGLVRFLTGEFSIFCRTSSGTFKATFLPDTSGTLRGGRQGFRRLRAIGRRHSASIVLMRRHARSFEIDLTSGKSAEIGGLTRIYGVKFVPIKGHSPD